MFQFSMYRSCTVYPNSEIIGGGGIQTSEDVDNYKANRCSHFSVSTLLFNRYKFMKFYLNRIHKRDI